MSPRVRWSIYLLLIALASGQVLGKILAVNSVSALDAEKSLRADFQTELKYLYAKSADLPADQALYAAALQAEFGVQAGTLIKKEDDRTALLAARDKANRKWPLETRRENWDQRKLEYSTADLLEQVQREIRKQRPFLSGNDRSRWLTVRALVERGTYEIDEFATRDGYWDTIDMVSHRNNAGEKRLYSSKPPLMATLIAGEYWLLHKITGWTLGDHPFELGRIMLVTFNLLPLIAGWLVFACLAEDWGRSDWGRIAAVAAICFATMMTTFSAALTNHLWAFVAGILATWDASRIWRGSRNPLYFLGAGFWSTFLFTNELPALALVAGLFLLLAMTDFKKTLLYAAPGALLVMAGFIGTNYLAHNTWRPAYSHGAGDVSEADLASSSEENWYNFTFTRAYDGRQVKSYWSNPSAMNPVDLGEPNKLVYAWHGLFGHHGNFSLTPILLLVIPGLLALPHLARDQKYYAWLILGVSVVCLGFYLFGMNQRQRNYGGPISAFRQLLWLHPLWLLAALPGFDWAARSTRRQIFVGVLLAWSMVSVTYPTWNPWVQNWIWNLYEYAGWPTISK